MLKRPGPGFYFSLQGLDQTGGQKNRATSGRTAEEVKRLPKETQELKSRKLSPDPIDRGRIILAGAPPLIDQRKREAQEIIDVVIVMARPTWSVHGKGTDQTCLSISPFLSLLTEALHPSEAPQSPFPKYWNRGWTAAWHVSIDRQQIRKLFRMRKRVRGRRGEEPSINDVHKML